MGRGNTAERLQKAKDKLDAASKLQGELGKQALKAIDNGADPALVFSLAEAAAKELIIEELDIRTVQVNNEIALLQHVAEKTDALHDEKKIQLRDLVPNPDKELRGWAGGLDGEYEGVQYLIIFEPNGIADTSSVIAEHVMRHNPGKYALVEE